MVKKEDDDDDDEDNEDGDKDVEPEEEEPEEYDSEENGSRMMASDYEDDEIENNEYESLMKEQYRVEEEKMEESNIKSDKYFRKQYIDGPVSRYDEIEEDPMSKKNTNSNKYIDKENKEVNDPDKIDFKKEAQLFNKIGDETPVEEQNIDFMGMIKDDSQLGDQDKNKEEDDGDFDFDENDFQMNEYERLDEFDGIEHAKEVPEHNIDLGALGRQHEAERLLEQERHRELLNRRIQIK